MNRIALDLGFIQIYWYSLAIMSGLILGLTLIFLELRRIKADIEYYFDMIFYVIIFSFLGARLYYVLFNLDYYLSNIAEIPQVWNGGLAIHGGIIGGVLTIILYGIIHKKDKNETLQYIDASSMGLIIGQIIGRWGNFFNSEAHGYETTRQFLEKIHIPNFIINGMYIDGVYYHPTFLYEGILNLVGLVLLLIISRIKKINVGFLTSIYLIWYGIVRIFIESFRTDSLMLGNIKVAQLLSIILIIIGIILLNISIFKLKKYNGKEE